MVCLQRAAGTFSCVRSMNYPLSSHHSCICMAFARLGGEFCQAQHLLLIVDKWTGEQHHNCRWYREVFIDILSNPYEEEPSLSLLPFLGESFLSLLLSWLLLHCSYAQRPSEYNLNGLGNTKQKGQTSTLPFLIDIHLFKHQSQIFTVANSFIPHFSPQLSLFYY